MRSYITQMQRTSQERLLSTSLAAGVLLLILSGLLDRIHPPVQFLVPMMGLYLGWLAWELYHGVTRFWLLDRSLDDSYEPWLGLGFALLAGIAIMLRLSGGLYSPFYPVFYLAVAFLASFGTASQGASWFGYALLLELAGVIASGTHQPGSVGRGALHLVFLGLFAGSHHLYLHGMLKGASRNRNSKRQIDHPHLTLAPAQEGAPAGMTMVSLEALNHDRQALLTLLKEGLDAHGCTFLWLSEDGQHYEVTAIETDAPDLNIGPFSVRTGTPASLFKGSTNIRISRSGEAGIHLPYYSRHTQVRSMLAVPVRQGQHVRGALCADRIHLAPFSAREEALLEAAAMVFGRALESERSYRRSDRDLQSLHQLQEVGQQLNQVRTEQELARQALDAASQFASIHWGFLVRYDQESDSHQILATRGPVQDLKGKQFALGSCLMSLALKHQCALPENGQIRSPGPYFAKEDPTLPDFSSLYLMPLILKDEPIGCLVLASEDPQCFADSERQKNLGTLTNQIAALLENARYTEKLEILAQHDGLTELYNHRTFMERLRETFLSAHRHQKNLSLLLLDIDHFKQINDRYGHPVGDQVLRRISAVLRDSAREIDIAARYGGEEFVLLLDETSTMGALKLADRLRKEVTQLSFTSDGPEPETFNVTISIGVATYPAHASEPDLLIRHADEALYAAKHRGRNRAVLYQAFDQAAPDQPDISFESLDALPQKGWGWGSLPPNEAPEDLVDPERWSWWCSNASQAPKSDAAFQADAFSNEADEPYAYLNKARSISSSPEPEDPHEMSTPETPAIPDPLVETP